MTAKDARRSNVLARGEDFHQQEFNVRGHNEVTADFVRTVKPRVVAEIGIYEGATSLEIAAAMGDAGALHLFDFEDRVRKVERRLRDAGHSNVVAHGNSAKGLDSYNWSLMRVLQAHSEPLFDYVFLDGAHTWNVDALAFLLLDRLVVPGGHVDFDDYTWSIARSPTMAPEVNLPSQELYTQEQMAEQHVRLIIDLLVRRDDRYVEVVPNKIFRKERA